MEGKGREKKRKEKKGYKKMSSQTHSIIVKATTWVNPHLATKHDEEDRQEWGGMEKACPAGISETES